MGIHKFLEKEPKQLDLRLGKGTPVTIKEADGWREYGAGRQDAGRGARGVSGRPRRGKATQAAAAAHTALWLQAPRSYHGSAFKLGAP